MGISNCRRWVILIVVGRTVDNDILLCLSSIMHHLPPSWQNKYLTLIQGITEIENRIIARAFTYNALSMSNVDLERDVLDILSENPEDERLLVILIWLTPVLSDKLKAQVISHVFSVVQKIEEINKRRKALSRICLVSKRIAWRHIEGFHPTWIKSLHLFSNQSRKELLKDLSFLMTIVVDLSDETERVEIYNTIRDVAHWWS